MEFRSRFKKQGESVTEYGFALNRIASDAYPRMPPEARETIVIDQFVSGLPSKDLRRHVQFHHPSSIHEAIVSSSLSKKGLMGENQKIRRREMALALEASTKKTQGMRNC